ncbi:MAG: hypothetical protein KKA79_08230 [Nanoarchaeota archaeon]|nr:hypothetical protein [Nanoarchaeota archaeon]MCG2718626.1 hypothetical protein [Nanoarchaeota archaeon]
MAMSPLAGAIEFLKDFGFYDVVLPFLLVFTIVFGVLEKTKLFGTEDKKPKKNINAMLAFVIALFFVASTELVAGARELLPNVVVLLITLMSFMMLVGFFYADKEFSFENNTFWKVSLTIIFFIGIVLLSMHAFVPDILEGLGSFWTSTTGVTIMFMAIIVATIFFVTKSKSSGGD